MNYDSIFYDLLVIVHSFNECTIKSVPNLNCENHMWFSQFTERCARKGQKMNILSVRSY